jgi:hypothetical protein
VSSKSPSPSRHHRWLLLVPFVWQVVMVPWANGVDARPLQLPFPMFWQMVGIIVTTVVIGIVFRVDRRLDAEHGSEHGSEPDAPANDA